MAQGKTQFIGAAGQYYVAYGLAVRQVHAALTMGNAPAVDILAADGAGENALSLQVKTSRNAYRKRRYGREGAEWDVGASAIHRWHENQWYALVDLQEGADTWDPQVYFVPSFWVAQFVKPEFSRKLFFLPATAFDITCEKWDLVQRFLSADPQTRNWATTWPEDELVRWGR